MPELEKHLNDGESLLWSGRAEFGAVLDETYKPALIRRSILCAVICAVLEVLYVLAANSSGSGVNWVFIAVIAAICVASPIAMVTRGRSIGKKYKYGATENRFLIAAGDKVMGMTYDRVKEAAFKRDEAGNVTLLCGKKAVKAKTAKWREITVFSDSYNSDEKADCFAYALYAPSEPEKLKKALKGRLAFTDET